MPLFTVGILLLWFIPFLICFDAIDATPNRVAAILISAIPLVNLCVAVMILANNED